MLTGFPAALVAPSQPVLVASQNSSSGWSQQLPAALVLLSAALGSFHQLSGFQVFSVLAALAVTNSYGNQLSLLYEIEIMS